MKKIAIFVSGAGEAAERIVKLFNEGNRVRTVIVVADESSQDILKRLKDEDVELVYMPSTADSQIKENVANLLRGKEVEMIVLDNYNAELGKEIEGAASGKILRVTSAEMAPREVVGSLEAHLRKPVEEEKPRQEEETPTLESEWADALKINYTPPQIPVTPPEVPKEVHDSPKEEYHEPIREEYHEPINEPIREAYHAPKRESEDPVKPMPSTWLIWSVLVTVFCCFIPGIVAIIFSSQVSSRYYSGDYEGAKRASRMAEIWIIVSFVLGVLTATLYIPFMIM